MMKVLHVVGARPNFMKIAPIMEQMARCQDHFEQVLVHTGQHYDDQMSQVFFDDLHFPRPDVYVGVGLGSRADQTAGVMLAFEPVFLGQRPDLVLFGGWRFQLYAGLLAGGQRAAYSRGVRGSRKTFA